MRKLRELRFSSGQGCYDIISLNRIFHKKPSVPRHFQFQETIIPSLIRLGSISLGIESGWKSIVFFLNKQEHAVRVTQGAAASVSQQGHMSQVLSPKDSHKTLTIPTQYPLNTHTIPAGNYHSFLQGPLSELTHIY